MMSDSIETQIVDQLADALKDGDNVIDVDELVVALADIIIQLGMGLGVCPGCIADAVADTVQAELEPPSGGERVH
jgi:hypothetical protein